MSLINLRLVLSLGLACILGGSVIQLTYAGSCQSCCQDPFDFKDETIDQTYARAAKGNSWAQLRLAKRYIEGNGTPVNFDLAQEWINLVKFNNPQEFVVGFGWLFPPEYEAAEELERVMAARRIQVPPPQAKLP